MRSDLRQTSLSTILRHLYSERRSGILHVSRHSIKKRVHFREGAIVFADNGDAESEPSRERAREIMFSLFTWTSGDVVFEDWETNISEALAFESATAELILEATRSIKDEKILGRLLGTQESVFACTQTTELPLFKMRLSPAESSVLTFARQRKQFPAVGSSPRFRRAAVDARAQTRSSRSGFSRSGKRLRFRNRSRHR